MSKLEIKRAIDGSVIKTLERHTEEDVERILQNAYNAFKNRKSWLKHHQRIAILNKLASLVEEKFDFFAETIALEGGKPLIDAKVEVARAIDGIKQAAKDLSIIFKGEEIPMGFTPSSENAFAATINEPIGVVLAISAFNHPLNLIVHQVIPAVAVGCPVLVKPASSTPTCCIELVKLVHKAGLDEAWCQSILCDNKVAEKVVADKRISFFTFIGSSNIGWYLRNKLANGTRYALEHGGCAPVIIDEKVEDLDKVVASVVKGGFYHAGQVCISVQRVFIHKSIFQEFTNKIKEAVLKLKTGDASLPDTEVGPLISPKEVDRIESWVNEAINEGATLLCGGKKITNHLYEPTVLVNPSMDSKVSCEEVFAPVISLYEIESLEEAVEKANALDLPFQAAVFTKDIDNAMQVFYNIESAGVIINEHSAFRVDWMPFAARRSAGYGIGGIYYTMHDMVNHKLMVIKSKGINN